jgi:hypothetical protein
MAPSRRGVIDHALPARLFPLRASSITLPARLFPLRASSITLPARLSPLRASSITLPARLSPLRASSITPLRDGAIAGFEGKIYYSAFQREIRSTVGTHTGDKAKSLYGGRIEGCFGTGKVA